MELLCVRVLRGPNVWARCKVLEIQLACDADERLISNNIKLKERLTSLFPDVDTVFFNTELGSLSLAHVLEFLVFKLQQQVGCPIFFKNTKFQLESGTFHVAVEYNEESVGRLAVEIALNLCLAAQNKNPSFDLVSSMKQLQAMHEEIRLGPSTQSIVTSALSRGIPFRRLTEGSMVLLGWGSRQRRIQGSVLDSNNVIATHIAQNKEITKEILAAHGLPVPQGRAVTSIDDAYDAACHIGFPVVVKPKNGRQGKGVVANVTSPEQLVNAYRIAAQYDDEILVERHVSGDDFRLLVVGHRLVAAARRDPPVVIGDGVHTILELVEQLNKDPRRGSGHSMPMTYVPIDDIARIKLEEQGLTIDSIPGRGQSVILRNNANLSSGGTATDVTDQVHPTIAQCAIDATRVTGGLTPCGVDLVCQRIDKPLHEQEAGIVEINASPGLRMHLLPSYGAAQDVGKAIIEALFAPGDDGRIPIISVTGTNGKTTTVRLIAHLLTEHGYRVGMTLTDGIYIEGKQIESGDCSGPKSANNILLNPDVDAAVFETARGGILREGLGFDHCNVAVITNIGKGDHLGMGGIHTAEDMAQVKQTIVSSLTSTGVAVLNAADPLVVAMAEQCVSSVLFFGFDKNNPVLSGHLAKGFRALYIEEQSIVAAEGGTVQYRIPLKQVPITHDGMISFQIENVLASVAAAWSIGLAWLTIHSALKTFSSDSATVPGRFNLFHHRGAKLIADYGHNEDAILSLVKAIEPMHANNRSLVITGTGDRRDQDIRRMTQILGDVFDNIYIYEMANRRGRSVGETTRLLREGLLNAKRAKVIEDINDEILAIDAALSQVKEGDLCLLLIDQVDRTLDYISKKIVNC